MNRYATPDEFRRLSATPAMPQPRNSIISHAQSKTTFKTFSQTPPQQPSPTSPLCNNQRSKQRSDPVTQPRFLTTANIEKPYVL